jgi:hypothetical protein
MYCEVTSPPFRVSKRRRGSYTPRKNAPSSSTGRRDDVRPDVRVQAASAAGLSENLSAKSDRPPGNSALRTWLVATRHPMSHTSLFLDESGGWGGGFLLVRLGV